MTHRPFAFKRFASVLISLLLLPLGVWAHGSSIGDLKIHHPYAVPTIGTSTTGAVYIRAIHNDGAQVDRLVAASTVRADSVELHAMTMDGDVMRMRQLNVIDLPAHSEVVMRQGSAQGYHLMLLGVKQPLKQGEKFPLTLRFERAGEVTVEVWVQAPKDIATHQH